MRSKVANLTRFALVIALTACVFAPVGAWAAPTNAKIKATKAEAAKAREELDDLADELELRSEDYAEIQDKLDQTREKIRTTEAELMQAERDLDAAITQLNGRANNIYREGDLDFVSVFVGVADFEDLVARLDYLRLVTRSDASIVASVEDARERIAETRKTLERRQAEQVALRNSAREKQAEVKQALANQKAYLNRVSSKLKKLISEERERQERLARERAAAAAAKASSVRSTRPFNGELGSAHPQVVSIARQFVGKTPYVWGGTSPSGFDCSGLVQYCYAKIGISLPRTSRTQFRAGAYIPPDRLDLLKAGDLVFFGYGGSQSRIHHVAIYAGGGMMIHAPQTGQKVSVSSLTARIASRGDYVGGCRP